MKNVSIPKITCGVLLALVICHMAYFWPLLPDEMATHFDAQWNPNGWMSKTVFMAFYAGIIAVMSLSFLGSMALAAKMPNLVSLPRRDYWLAPERREETLAYLGDSLLRFHNITITFLAAIMHIVMKYNTGGKIDSELFWILFSAYMGYTVVWTVLLTIRFMRTPAGTDEQETA